MSKYASKQFWVDTLDRAVATVAQAAIATLTAGVTGILDVDWVQIGSVAGLAGAVSVLTSIAFRGRESGVDTSATETAWADIRDEVLADFAALPSAEQEAAIRKATNRH